MLAAGSIVGGGKFRIDSLLGAGGMGVVAIATHLQLEQRVAIKVLHDALAVDPAIVERFLREAKASVRLRSEHVCKVSDVGQLEGGAPYIVMELLEGADLAKVIERQPLPIAVAVEYVLQASIAIAEAHALGIVHRDLKPANLFLARRFDGSPLVKVLDFGIAKAQHPTDFTITRTSAVMGSPGYMSPEQLRSARDVDARTDLWALGVILYELVSKRLPFPGESITELAVKVAMDPPAPLGDVPAAFAAIVMRCLEKDPAKRYQSVGELAAELAPLGGDHAAAHLAVIRKVTVPAPVLEPSRAIASAPTAMDTGFALGSAATSPSDAAAPTPTPTLPRPRPRTRLVVIGALLAGAVIAVASFAAMRGGSGSQPAADARLARDAAVAIVPPAPADAPAADAPASPTELRKALHQLADARDWTAVIRVGREVGKDDPEIGQLVASARTSYLAQQGHAIDVQIKEGNCVRAHSLATDALIVVPEDASLVTRAEACKAKAATFDVTDAHREYLDEHYTKSLQMAAQLVKADPTATGAVRIAAMSACALKQPKVAAVYASKLDSKEAASVIQDCKMEGVVIGDPASPPEPAKP